VKFHNLRFLWIVLLAGLLYACVPVETPASASCPVADLAPEYTGDQA
jgi:hypothetical protein